MPRLERDRVLSRIAQLEVVLRETRSDDVRETLRHALEDCKRRLAELNTQLGIEEPDGV